MNKCSKITFVVVALMLVLCNSGVFAETRLYTSGAMDGMAGRDWYSSPNYYWVDTSSPTVNSNHDGSSRWSYRGVAIIDISSLAGQILAPNSVSFNFYSFGFSGTQLQHLNSDPGAQVTTSFAQATGTFIASLDETEGWKSYDVTNLIQSDINNGFMHVGFIFPAVVNYGGGAFASSEDTLGRSAYLSVPTVPEPSSIIALVGGLFPLLSQRRRRT